MQAANRIPEPFTTPSLTVHSRAKLPSTFGNFSLVSFVTPEGRLLDDVAILRGDPNGVAAVPVRMHSECLTGDALGSLRCDCRDQLELSLRRFGAMEVAALLYLRQEGRGIGIARKVAAYHLQDCGLDTVQANMRLGLPDDARRYDYAASMLRALGVLSVNLHTNNPRKIEGLRDHGIIVEARAAVITAVRADNARYLSTKRKKSGHLL